MTVLRAALATLTAATLFAPLASATGQALKPAASGRATATLTLNGNRAPSISLDYGVPHARGRTVTGALPGDLGNVWRLGANEPTILKTDADLTIGTLAVPKGSYRLAAQTSATGAWQLLINKETTGWGIPYPAAAELGKVTLTSRTLGTPIESFTMWLIPAADGSAAGEIRFAWGTREFSAPWRVK